MRYWLALLLLWPLWLRAIDLKPTAHIQMDGLVKDIVLRENRLYAGTANGMLEVYDLRSKKIVEKITLKKIHDFMGEIIEPKIYSVDAIGEKKLMLAEGENGARNLFISEHNQTKKRFSSTELSMLKARFIDAEHVFMGLLSNEMVLLDLKSGKLLYDKQVSESRFSDFALNESRSVAVVACESGIDYLFSIPKGRVIKELKGANKDNVFKVDIKKNLVSSAGKDKKGALYHIDTGSYTLFPSNFMVFATALSPKGDLVAFSSGVDNDIAIYDVATGERKYTLKGTKSTLNAILFKDEHTLFSASDDKEILEWHLP